MIWQCWRLLKNMIWIGWDSIFIKSYFTYLFGIQGIGDDVYGNQQWDVQKGGHPNLQNVFKMVHKEEELLDRFN